MPKHRIRARHRIPGQVKRAELLTAQQGRCFYCACPLREFSEVRGKVRYSGLHWDHVIPWAYCQRNDDANFVASCQVCNLIKSDKVFETIDQAREYVRQERINRDLRVFELQKSVRQEKALAKVLQSKMQNRPLLEASRNRKYTPRSHIGMLNGEYVRVEETPHYRPWHAPSG